MFFTSCEPDEPEHIKIETGIATDITSTSVVLHGSLDIDMSLYDNVRIGVMIATTPIYIFRGGGAMYETDMLVGNKFKLQLNNLYPSTKYYYRVWVLLDTERVYAQEKTFRTLSPENYEICTDYVDLGLSVKWATCNVGASSPEGYGTHFAWGEVDLETKEYYEYSTYKWCDGSYNTITKYCTNMSNGSIDNKTILELEDDAATVNMGESWRIPTFKELQELSKKCIWTWTILNGVKGYNVEGPNGNSIFLPAAGGRYDSDYNSSAVGFYWSSSLCMRFPCSAYGFYFNSNYVDCKDFDWEEDVDYSYDRCHGLSVRGVMD